MAGFGIQQDEIATLIDCDPKTLRKYYRRELDTAATEANVRVAQSLYNLATKEKNVAACIWWTKARMGWKEATDVNVGGQGGGPVTYEFSWRADPEPAAAPPSKREPPVIDVEAGDTHTGTELTVTWAGEATEGGD